MDKVDSIFKGLRKVYVFAFAGVWSAQSLRYSADVVTRTSDIEAKVRDATNNDAWGPSGTQLGELADTSYR